MNPIFEYEFVVIPCKDHEEIEGAEFVAKATGATLREAKNKVINALKGNKYFRFYLKNMTEIADVM